MDLPQKPNDCKWNFFCKAFCNQKQIRFILVSSFYRYGIEFTSYIFSKKANKRTVLYTDTQEMIYIVVSDNLSVLVLFWSTRFFFVCVYFIKIFFTLYLNPNDTKQILNLCHFRSFFYTFTDRRRLEICLYGVGQDFPLGIFPCLCLRYHWHHFPESIIVWYTTRCWQEVEWNTITEKQFYVANGYWTDDNWLK